MISLLMTDAFTMKPKRLTSKQFLNAWHTSYNAWHTSYDGRAAMEKIRIFTGLSPTEHFDRVTIPDNLRTALLDDQPDAALVLADWCDEQGVGPAATWLRLMANLLPFQRRVVEEVSGGSFAEYLAGVISKPLEPDTTD